MSKSTSEGGLPLSGLKAVNNVYVGVFSDRTLATIGTTVAEIDSDAGSSPAVPFCITDDVEGVYVLDGKGTRFSVSDLSMIRGSLFLNTNTNFHSEKSITVRDAV
jgi:hypothetical protein